MFKNRLTGALLALSAAGAGAQTMTTQVYMTGISRPVFMTNAGDGSGRLFVIEQRGAIRIIDGGGNLLPTPFLDIDSSVTGGTSGSDERGMLGLAFHPDYENNGKFYVDYTTTLAGLLTTVVEEYTVSAGDPDLADVSSGRPILTITQPFTNHNGGWLGFGPDGYLYIGTGDGGSANDPGNRASQLNFMLGKLLRIDVDSHPGGAQYGIPLDNPFANDGNPATLDEIWDYGLRNPWRTSFDRETGDLWIADVGQNAHEEINFEPAGDAGGNHYGWRCREGLFASGIGGCPATDPLWVDPVHDYSHALGCSITGGYVYRGCELGDGYVGKYFFSDYCTGTIWYLDPANNYARSTAFDTNFNVSSFGEDENGELYIANLFTNTVYRLVLVSPPDENDDGIIDTCEAPPCPADLAEPTGVLNIFDIQAFIALYNAGDSSADLAAPLGVFNFFDITAYIALYNKGCP